jgi:hypothetical protein
VRRVGDLVPAAVDDQGVADTGHHHEFGGTGNLCLSTAGIALVSYSVYAVPCTSPGDPTVAAQRWAAKPMQ